MANNNNKNVTLEQLTTMDTTVKNYIQSKDGDLIGLLTVDKSNLTNAIKEINNGLNDINTTATTVDTTVDGMTGGATVVVSLVESEDTVEINGENLVCKTYAISQNNIPIATINVPIDLSVEEGAVISETDDNTGETTTYLKLKTTGASEYNLSLDVSSLVSGFSIQQDGILTLESGEITGELEDNSVENSNIIDGNITEQKLSLGLQEKLAKAESSKTDIAVLKTEAETLIDLHKIKASETSSEVDLTPYYNNSQPIKLNDQVYLIASSNGAELVTLTDVENAIEVIPQQNPTQVASGLDISNIEIIYLDTYEKGRGNDIEFFQIANEYGLEASNNKIYVYGLRAISNNRVSYGCISVFKNQIPTTIKCPYSDFTSSSDGDFSVGSTAFTDFMEYIKPKLGKIIAYLNYYNIVEVDSQPETLTNNTIYIDNEKNSYFINLDGNNKQSRIFSYNSYDEYITACFPKINKKVVILVSNSDTLSDQMPFMYEYYQSTQCYLYGYSSFVPYTEENKNNTTTNRIFTENEFAEYDDEASDIHNTISNMSPGCIILIKDGGGNFTKCYKVVDQDSITLEEYDELYEFSNLNDAREFYKTNMINMSKGDVHKVFNYQYQEEKYYSYYQTTTSYTYDYDIQPVIKVKNYDYTTEVMIDLISDNDNLIIEGNFVPSYTVYPLGSPQEIIQQSVNFSSDSPLYFNKNNNNSTLGQIAETFNVSPISKLLQKNLKGCIINENRNRKLSFEISNNGAADNTVDLEPILRNRFANHQGVFSFGFSEDKPKKRGSFDFDLLNLEEAKDLIVEDFSSHKVYFAKFEQGELQFVSREDAVQDGIVKTFDFYTEIDLRQFLPYTCQVNEVDYVCNSVGLSTSNGMYYFTKEVNGEITKTQTPPSDYYFTIENGGQEQFDLYRDGGNERIGSIKINGISSNECNALKIKVSDEETVYFYVFYSYGNRFMACDFETFEERKFLCKLVPYLDISSVSEVNKTYYLIKNEEDSIVYSCVSNPYYEYNPDYYNELDFAKQDSLVPPFDYNFAEGRLKLRNLEISENINLTTFTSTSYYAVAEEIAKNIGDIPLATTTANGLMPKEDVTALDGTYVDTTNNELYIKGQKVVFNSTASDDDINELIDNFLGTRKIPITDEITAGEGYCYEPSDEEEDGVMGVRITEDNKANFIDSSFYTLVGDNHDENYVFVPEQGFDTMQQFLQFQDNAVTLVKKVAIAADEDRARADHAYYTRAYYQDDKQDVKVTRKNYDKLFYTKNAHKNIRDNWIDLYGEEVTLTSTDNIDTVKTLLANNNNEGLFDAYYSNEQFDKQREFNASENNTSTGEQVEVVDFDTSKLDGYVAYVQASGTYVSGTTYYTDNNGNTEVDTSGFVEGVTDVSSYYVSSKHNFFAKNKIVEVDGEPSKIQAFLNWIFGTGKINASSIQPGGVAYIQNDLVGLATFARLQKHHTAANYNSFTKENFDKVLGRTIVLDQPINGTYTQATGTYVSGTIYYTNYMGTEEVNTSTFVEGVTDVSNYYIKVNTYPRYIVYAYNIIRDNTQTNTPLNAQEKVPNDILEYVRPSSHIQDGEHLLDENNQSNYGSIAFSTFEAAKRYLEYNGRIPSSEPTIVAPNWSRLPGVVHISTVKFVEEDDEFTTIDDTINNYVSLRNLKKLLLNNNVEYVKVSFNAGVVNHNPICWGNPPEPEAEDALKTRTIDTTSEAKAVEVTAENLWEFRGKRFSFEIPKLPDGTRAQTSNGNTALEVYNTLNPYNYVYWDGEPHEENKDIYTEDFRNAYRGVYSSDIGRTVWVDKGQLTV